MMENRPLTIGIIPARFGSSRLPGKPLALIIEKPMIQHTFERAKLAKNLHKVIVATDDDRIAQCVKDFGGEAVMTSSDCATGTDRCWEAVQKLDESYEVIINIQGDEPMVDPDHIDLLTSTLYESPTEIKITAAAAPILSQHEVESRAVTKVVMDSSNRALYFSRAMIPHSKEGVYHKDTKYFRNCGMYCFRRNFLGRFATATNSSLQNEEDLEQLKILEMGERIQMCLVKEAIGGIDTQEQLDELNKKLKSQ